MAFVLVAALLVAKLKVRETRPVVNRAANAFRMAAQTAGKSNSALGAFYRRLRSRLGAPKAITATAHAPGTDVLPHVDDH